MLRRCWRLLDTTKQPHKQYRYGYMPDPRKVMPLETISDNEVKPTLIRPPCSVVPDVETFLTKIQEDELAPAGDFKSSFTSWRDLMTASREDMISRGIPTKTAGFIARWTEMYRAGEMPERYDRTNERLYWRSFKAPQNSQVRLIELPDKYRPHQLGEDTKPIPNYTELNTMPEWAVKEEQRLAEKKPPSSS